VISDQILILPLKTPMPPRFYIWEDEERHGPYSESQVERMLEDRIISFSHQCENASTGETVMLDELFETVPENEPEQVEAEAEDDVEWEYEEGEEEAVEDESEEEWEEEGEHEERAEEEGAADEPPPNAILFIGHPTILRYGAALILVVLAAAFGLWFGPKGLWFFIAGFGVAILTLIAVLIDRSTQVYMVTPKRVELVWGLLTKSSNEVRIEDIRTINVRRKGFSGLLGIGTIEFSSTGDKIDVTFTDIWAAQKVKALVRELQDGMEDW
jgi:hypothetical protein